MTEPSLIARQRVLLRELIQRAAERAHAEPAIAAAFQEQVDAVENEFADGRDAVNGRLQREQEENERQFEQARASIEARYNVEQDTANRDYNEAHEEIVTREKFEKKAAEAAYKEACWTIGAVLEGAINEAEQEVRENKTRLMNRLDNLHTIHKEARALLEEWKQSAKELEASARDSSPADPSTAPPKLSECVVEAQRLLEQLQELVVPRYLKARRFFAMVVFVWLASILPLGFLAGRIWGKSELSWTLILGLIASSLTVLAIGPFLQMLLAAVARSQIRHHYEPLYQTILEAESTRQLLLDRYENESRQRVLESKKQHNEEVRRAHTAYRQQRAASKRRLEQDLPPVEDRYRDRQRESERQRAADLHRVREMYEHRLLEIQQRHDEDMRQLQARREQLLQEVQQHRDADWNTLVEDWRQAMNGLQTSVAEINETTRRLMPGWDDPSWQQWQPPATIPPVLRLGQYHIRLDQVPKGVPADPGLRALTPAAFELPALCDFPARSSLLLQAATRAEPSPCRRCRPSSSACSPRCRPVRCASSSSIRSAWARTSPPSCTWPTTTRCWSPAVSGRRRRTSSSAWPT